MEPIFWHDRWQKGDIGFHQSEVNDLLRKHWPSLGFAPGSQVFVPLCGKSHDMAWLAAAGHHVIGAELSPVAVDAFFAERDLAPETRLTAGFSVKSAGPYELWCGDVFAFPVEAVAGCDAAYDRAALVAFPPEMQPRYAKKLIAILPRSARVLLVGLDFDQSVMAGPPFSTPRAQVEDLFGASFRIAALECCDGLKNSPNLKKRGVTRLEEALYLLERT